MTRKISSRALGAILVLLGVLLLGGSTGAIPLAIVCGPGNNCTPNTHIENIMFGSTILSTSTTAPIIVSATSGTLIVNYYVPTGESIQSWSVTSCTSLTSDKCPAGSQQVTVTNQPSDNRLSGMWIAPSYATTTGGFIFFYVTVTDSDGITATYYGSMQYAPGAKTGQVNISSTPPGATVTILQGSTEVAQITTVNQAPVAVTLPYGSYTWGSMAPGYNPDTGSFTVSSASYSLVITMQSSNSPPVTSTVTGTTTYTTGISTCTWVQTSVIVSQDGAASTSVSGLVACGFPVGASSSSSSGSSSTSTTSTSPPSSGSSVETTGVIAGLVLVVSGFALIVSKKKEIGV